MEHKELVNKIDNFVKYCKILKGDEKGEAQVFCDRFFQAFGYAGYKEAGAELEYRIKRKKSTSFADLLWKERLLIEMKKRGEDLSKHYDQLRDYWHDNYPKTKYSILCNFDEFWVYDFFNQSEPVDKINLSDLHKRYTAFNFMLSEDKKPVFQNDMVEVSRTTAEKVVQVFHSLLKRGEKREVAQRFILQCVFAMFAEDFDLLQRSLFTELLYECEEGSSTYDLIGSLFRQMDNPISAKGGRFKGVPYFNGGLFAIVEPIELIKEEIALLKEAALEDWAKVQPPVFGSIFEGSMNSKQRHALGAHFTNEADIKKVIRPTIEKIWKDKIKKAKTLQELEKIHEEIQQFKVLDPACGCGNFLYVAYRELKRIELILIKKIHENFGSKAKKRTGTSSRIRLHQFYGIDINPFAVELAKVTMMLAKEQAIEENRKAIEGQIDLQFDFDPALPLDNIDNNIICNDALFCDWPKTNVIIGNPPYQSKNKMQQELGADYITSMREKYPEISGRADYCVYWFRKAHDELSYGGRAGLVGTNTIRQNYSREGSLDYIVANNGTITDAVSTQVWSGDAVVHVSIVNWIKGNYNLKKTLLIQNGDNIKSPWMKYRLDFINASLSTTVDVTSAKILNTNVNSESCYQGQTHGHKGFFIQEDKALSLLKNKKYKNNIFPFLTGKDILGKGFPSRWIIDLNHCSDIIEAMKYDDLFSHINKKVMPEMKKKADEEIKNSKKLTGPRQNHYKHWWRFWRGRPEMIEKISTISRYISCARVTKRPVFEFISSSIHPNDALMVFPLEDDYSFGILQSGLHWNWFKERCSTLKGDFRYTSNTVFDTFPWPQSPTEKQIKEIAENAVNLRKLRNKIMSENNMTFRDLYRTLDLPGTNSLKAAHDKLDNAVKTAYKIKAKDNILEFLLSLNHKLIDKESKGEKIVGPGLPNNFKNVTEIISDDCIRVKEYNP